jgi:hypothetical protein
VIGRLASEACWRLLRLSRAGGGRAFGVLSIWIGVDAVFSRLGTKSDIRPTGVLRYHAKAYRGPGVRLRDGTVVDRGDRLLELHVANERVQTSLQDGSWSPWRWLDTARRDLEELAERSRTGKLGDFRALHGVTLLHAGARRLGFEIRPLPPTLQVRLERFYLVGLEAVTHPNGIARLERGRRRHWPAEIWLSRQALENRDVRRRTRTS